MSPLGFAPPRLIVPSIIPLVLCLVGPAAAQVATTPLSTAPPSKSYDARELSRLLDAQTNATDIFARSRFPAATQPSEAEQTARVIKLIQQKIDPTSWLENGGTIGSIETRRDGTILVIQKQENLDSLDLMLRESHIQITLETRFVTGGGMLSKMEICDGDWKQLGDAKVWREFLDDAAVDEIIRDLQTQQRSTTLTAPRLTMFNQQPAIVAVATDTAYVAEIKPLADGTLEPQVQTFSSGVTLECRCTVRPDHQSLTAEIHPRLSRLINIEPAPWPAPPATRQAFIQVPHASIAEMRETFDIPSGKSLLIRLTPKVIPAGAKANADATQAVFVLVRPTMIARQEN